MKIGPFELNSGKKMIRPNKSKKHWSFWCMNPPVLERNLNHACFCLIYTDSIVLSS